MNSNTSWIVKNYKSVTLGKVEGACQKCVRDEQNFMWGTDKMRLIWSNQQWFDQIQLGI